MDWIKKAKILMRNKGIKQVDLISVFGVGTAGAVGHYFTGRRKPSVVQMKALSAILDCTVDQLLSDSSANVVGHGLDKIGKVPLISSESVANDIKSDVIKWLMCPVEHGPNTYALKVSGDSMTNPHPGKSYPDGTIIFIDPDRIVISGCRVIAKIPGSDTVTFKEYREDSGCRFLKPINPQYQTQQIDDDTEIIGVIIGKWEDD